MAETVEKEQPTPNIWDTLASAQGAPSQNNDGWDQSDGWGQPVKNDSQWESDGWGKSSSQREPDRRSWTRSRTRSPGCGRSRDVRRNPRSTGGDSRQRINRGRYQKEESPSPPGHGRKAARHFRRYRDPLCDRRRESWSKEEASRSPRRSAPYSRQEASRHDWGKRGESSDWRQRDHPVSPNSHLEEHNWTARSPGKERRGHSPNSNPSNSRGTGPVCTTRTQVERENKPALSSARLPLPNLNGRNAHDAWGAVSPAMIQSRSRSSSPWSQAAQNVKKSDNTKESDAWGPSSLPVDQSRSRSLSPWSQAAHDLKQNYLTKETDGWDKALDKTGPDASNNSRPNISPDRAVIRRRCGWGSTHLTLPDLNGRNGDDGWGTVSPAMIRSRSRSSSPWSQAAQNVKKSDDAKESDGWGSSSLNVDRSRSRSLSPWSQAAHDIKKNYHNKETDGWGNLDKTGPDVWNKYRPNTSPDCAFNRRRIGWGSRDCSHSPVPRWRRTERDQDRSRGRDSSYVPCNRQRRSTCKQGRSRSRERGRTNSPGRDKSRVGRVMDEAFSRPQISSQDHGDVKGKAVMNSPAIEHSTDGPKYLNLSYDPWDNNAPNSISHAMGTISLNPDASQSLSNQKNLNLNSGAEVSKSTLLGLESNATASILAGNPFVSDPWSIPSNMLQNNSGSSTIPCNQPTLEHNSSFAATSSMLNWGGPKSNLVPTGWRPPYMPMLNAPTISHGVDSAAITERLANFLTSFPPFASSNNTYAATAQVAPLYSPIVSTDAPLQPYQPKSAGTVSSTSSAFAEARSPKSNMDAAMQFKSCTATKAETSRATGTDTEAESSAVNPTPMVSMVGLSQPNENPVVANGEVTGATTDKVDNVTFKRVLIDFAKGKLRPFWLKQQLTRDTYRLILRKFLQNVTGSLGTRAPQNDMDSHKFIKEQDDSLSELLKVYLLRYVSQEVIENIRDS